MKDKNLPRPIIIILIKILNIPRKMKNKLLLKTLMVKILSSIFNVFAFPELSYSIHIDKKNPFDEKLLKQKDKH